MLSNDKRERRWSKERSVARRDERRRRQMRRFVMRPVQSSLISHAGWFSVGLLVLRLNSGDIWAYQPVDRYLWLSFCHSRSKGRWFNKWLRGSKAIGAAKVEGKAKDVIESYIQGATRGIQ